MQSSVAYVLLFIVSLFLVPKTTAFGLSSRLSTRQVASNSRLYLTTPPAETNEPPAVTQSKGFGTKKAPKETEVVEKDAGTKTYESQAKRGVPEYNIWLRPINGSDAEWVPVGSMTIPRNVQVEKAVFEVEQDLLKGTFKLYPKLKAFVSVRGDDKIFEYGYTLKAFPDEPIKPLKRPDPTKENQKGGFLANWLSSITNPIDTSSLSNNVEITLKQ